MLPDLLAVNGINCIAPALGHCNDSPGNGCSKDKEAGAETNHQTKVNIKKDGGEKGNGPNKSFPGRSGKILCQ